MPSANSPLSASDQVTLLAVARLSIEHGLHYGRALQVNPEDYPESLRPIRATFVTLHAGERLRGCIGTLEARFPLVTDVALHAYGAAFTDPRFTALTAEEFAPLRLHVSVLSPPEPIAFTSEEDLLKQIRPGLDGLVLQAGDRRGTFLPAVWEMIAEPRAFLAHLKVKAGLPMDFWSDDLRVERYTTESFGEDEIITTNG